MDEGFDKEGLLPLISMDIVQTSWASILEVKRPLTEAEVYEISRDSHPEPFPAEQSSNNYQTHPSSGNSTISQSKYFLYSRQY